MEVTGRCLCQRITYRARIDQNAVSICHCTDCQRNSGTAFGVVASVVDDSFALLSGELKFHVKIAESGAERELAFCGDCGSRIYARKKGDPAGFTGLRVGTIDQRGELTPTKQIWCRSAQRWALLDGIPRFETQSDA